MELKKYLLRDSLYVLDMLKKGRVVNQVKKLHIFLGEEKPDDLT